MNKLKHTFEHLTQNLVQYVRWLFLSSVIGVAVGAFCSLFSYCLNFSTQFRTDHDFVIFLLPLGGILIVFLYRFLHYEATTGTDYVIQSIHEEKLISIRMAVLIFFSTIITIFCGGSVGREGAALQIGGSIGSRFGQLLHFNEKDRKILLMSGMSAAFAALFGTPMAAAFFSMEVASVGIFYYAAIVPCIVASLIASQIPLLFGISSENFHVLNNTPLALVPGFQVLLLAICCAMLSIFFLKVIHKSSDLFRKILKNPYLRIAVGGLLIITFTFLFQSRDYLGTGMPIIERALNGSAIPYAFLLKILFTAITISAGFKGGEIIPTLFIGATFGCFVGGLIGLPPTLGAAVGMVALFCGVTNCPITSLLISFELFGFADSYYYLIAIATSYMLSGYVSLYHTQVIVYSKVENTFINKKAEH